MNMSKFKVWLEFGASAGIIAGLILVGVQIRQNSQLLKTQLLFEEGLAYAQYEQAMLGENPAVVWAEALESPTELTLEEQRVIDAYLWSARQHWDTLYQLSQQGLIEEEWQQRVKSEAPFIFNNPYARAWWKIYVAGREPSDVIDLVNQILDERPEFTIDDYNQIQEAVEMEVELKSQ